MRVAMLASNTSVSFVRSEQPGLKLDNIKASTTRGCLVDHEVRTRSSCSVLSRTEFSYQLGEQREFDLNLTSHEPGFSSKLISLTVPLESGL